jgi:hypothetical protein
MRRDGPLVNAGANLLKGTDVPVLPPLEQAIRDRSPVAFRYVREGKTDELRIGDPHALYMKRLKDGTESVYLDVWQTDGASDSGQPLPSWRRYFLEGIRDVELQADRGPFETCPTYNPSSYEYPICKI